jgi:hypothetical protein
MAGSMNNKEVLNMASNTRYYETGATPYYLNTNNTAKEASNQETTNPSFGLLDFLEKHVIIERNVQFTKPTIEENISLKQTMAKPNRTGM